MTDILEPIPISQLPVNASPPVLTYAAVIVWNPDKLGPGVGGWENARVQVSQTLSPVTSVFGRSGAVVAQTGDYTAAQVGAGGLSTINTWQNSNIFNGTVNVADSNFLIRGNVNANKIAKFEVDGYSAAVTHTYTVPDADGTLALTSQIRTRLAANLVINVPSEFATMQAAWDHIVANLDVNGKVVTIQLADGTYNSGIQALAGWTGGGSITIKGNGGTPTNVVLDATAGYGFLNLAVLPGTVLLRDMKMKTSAAGVGCITNQGIGNVSWANIVFDTVANNGTHLGATNSGAVLTCAGNYSIIGGAGIHALAQDKGQIFLRGFTCAITGTPAFAFAFVGAVGLSEIVAVAAVYTGAGGVTGSRYLVTLNSLINTGGGGANFFPGNAVGVNDGTGVYA